MADRTIYKYELVLGDTQTVHMPIDARILTAQFQGDTLCLWVVVEPGVVMEPRDIRIVGTGRLMPPESLRFIATAQRDGLVWHVFEQPSDQTPAGNIETDASGAITYRTGPAKPLTADDFARAERARWRGNDHA